MIAAGDRLRDYGKDKGKRQAEIPVCGYNSANLFPL